MIAGGDAELALGDPYLPQAKVQAEVIEHGRHAKVNILKFRRRKHHLKRQGHRQHYTQVKITGINAG
jgi:large subunit ribosomal protein L21